MGPQGDGLQGSITSTEKKNKLDIKPINVNMELKISILNKVLLLTLGSKRAYFEWITVMLIWTETARSMIDNITQSIYAASAGTRVATFVIVTSQVRRTICIK